MRLRTALISLALLAGLVAPAAAQASDAGAAADVVAPSSEPSDSEATGSETHWQTSPGWEPVAVLLENRLPAWLEEARGLAGDPLPENSPAMLLVYGEDGALRSVEVEPGYEHGVFAAALTLVLQRQTWPEVSGAGQVLLPASTLGVEAADARQEERDRLDYGDVICDRWAVPERARAALLLRQGRTARGLGVAGLVAGGGLVALAVAGGVSGFLPQAAVPLLATAGGSLLVIGGASLPAGLQVSGHMTGLPRFAQEAPFPRQFYLNQRYWAVRAQVPAGVSLAVGGVGALATGVVVLARSEDTGFGVLLLAAGGGLIGVGTALAVTGNRRVKAFHEGAEERFSGPPVRFSFSLDPRGGGFGSISGRF